MCRPLIPGELSAAHRLVEEVFREQVASEFNDEGVRTFLDYIAPESLARRAMSDHDLIGAEAEYTGELVGVAEVRRKTHLALLFVRLDMQGRGVAKELLDYVMDSCRARGYATLTVHAAPNAVAAYEALGFTAEGGIEQRDGIRYVPMIRSVLQ